MQPGRFHPRKKVRFCPLESAQTYRPLIFCGAFIAQIRSFSSFDRWPFVIADCCIGHPPRIRREIGHLYAGPVGKHPSPSRSAHEFAGSRLKLAVCVKILLMEVVLPGMLYRDGLSFQSKLGLTQQGANSHPCFTTTRPNNSTMTEG